MIAINHRAAALVLGGLLAWPYGGVARAQVFATPSLIVREEYDDNITFRSRGQLSDFITAAQPGLLLEVSRYPWNILLNGFVRAEVFANHSEFDNVGDNASVSATVGFNATRTLTLSLTETFFRHVDTLEGAPDRRDIPAETGIRAAGRSVSTDNRIGAGMRYEPDPRTLVDLRYAFETFRSNSVSARDSDTHAADLLVRRQLTPRDGGTFRYTFDHFEVQGEPTLTAHFPRLGVVHSFSPTINVTAEAGPIVSDSRDGTEVTAGGTLRYDQRFSRGGWSLAYDRSPQLAGRIGGAGVSQGLTLTTDFAATRTTTISFTSTARETEETAGPKLRSIVAGVGVNYQPTRELLIRLNATVGDHRSSDSTTSFLAYTADAQISYRLSRWLSVLAGYRFQRQDDRAGNNNLQRNVIFIGVAASDRFRIY